MESASVPLETRLSQLEAKVNRLEDLLGDAVYRPVREIAEESNRFPDTYSGLKRWLGRHDIPLRNAGGARKEKGSREVAYVDIRELHEEAHSVSI